MARLCRAPHLTGRSDWTGPRSAKCCAATSWGRPCEPSPKRTTVCREVDPLRPLGAGMKSSNALTRPLRQFRPYPAYRESGVELPSRIPSGWGVKRLKFAAKIEAGQSPPSDFVSDGHDGLPFLQGNAEFGAINPLPSQICDAAPKRAEPGDILLSVRAPVGALNVADQSYGIGRGLCSIRFAESLDLRFGFYLLAATRDQLNSVAAGSTYDAVSTSDVGDLPALFPAHSEQRAIAAFLDRETARIDELVAKEERPDRAASGGEPRRPHYPGGDEGPRPERWDEGLRCRVAGGYPRPLGGQSARNLRRGSGQDIRQVVNTLSIGRIVLCPGSVWPTFGKFGDEQVEYVSDTSEKISELGLANSSARLLPKGTVILSRTASVGFAGILAVDMATTQDFVNWICREELLPEYLLYVFRSMKSEFTPQRLWVRHIRLSTCRTLVPSPVRSRRCASNDLSSHMSGSTLAGLTP